ncbi:hypothetical protein BDZ89DRAFT_1127788 [Hymenopellis radicata]|nr:hypothetical protein BDZ89DRAFT_1127788 [Hymenopellis radicata]
MSSRRLAISSLLNEDEQQDLDKEKEKEPAAVVTGLDALVHAASQLPSISTFDPAAAQPKKRRHSDTLHDHAPHTMGPGVPPYNVQQRPLSMEGRRPQLINQYPLIDQYPRSADRERVRSPVFPRPVQERILSPPHERLPHTLDSHRFPTSSRDFVSPKLSARDFAREGRDQVGIDHSRERSSDIGLLRESSRERRDSVPPETTIYLASTNSFLLAGTLSLARGTP